MADCRRFFGLDGFAWSDDLHDSAYRWASQLSLQGHLSHSSMRDLLYRHPKTWRRVGENVGTGGTVEAVMDAWVHSPPHFHNLAERDFNNAAVAVVETGGVLWLVQHFATIR